MSTNLSDYSFNIPASKAKELLGTPENTLREYRYSGELIQGIHYIKLGYRGVKYNQAMVTDWLVNRHSPEAHSRAIEYFQSLLPSNQKLPSKAGRPKTAA